MACRHERPPWLVIRIDVTYVTMGREENLREDNSSAGPNSTLHTTVGGNACETVSPSLRLDLAALPYS